MKVLLQRFILVLLLIQGVASLAQDQELEEEVHYPKTLTIKLGMGPTYLAVDNGIHIQNQFELELGKHFTLAATYGTAQAYSGLEDIQRWYFPPDIDIQPDDHFRHQTMLFANLGFQISPLNIKHHRLYVGLGPSVYYHNFSKAEILPHADSTAFVMTNSKTINIAYNIFGGYDLRLGDHIVLGLSFYYLSFTDEMYSILLHGGYRF